MSHLLQQSGRATEASVSPWMLYSMARRYDEFPGADDAGSSLRGALKGWHKHGACALRLWEGIDMPRATNVPDEDWWLDAVNRPLGAYYRIDTRSITDMHVALHEAGILYASAICHGGWLEGARAKRHPGWQIPMRKAKPADGGHAFAIVGYDASGFLVHNSWGEEWGDGGFATLTYADWLAHAMDCWVAQLGVVTAEHRRVASARTPSSGGRHAAFAADRMLRRHQLAPYVIDMENNGRLSRSGAFRTGEDDVHALANVYLDAARRDWGVKAGQPLDICLYAHGGLVGEGDAAATFARWWPALYAARCFPIFLMWESDLWSTIKGRLEDTVKAAPRPTAGPLEALGRWWDARLESLLAPAGTSALGRDEAERAGPLRRAVVGRADCSSGTCCESDVAKRHPAPAAPRRAFRRLHRARLPHRPAGGAGVGIRQRHLPGAGNPLRHLRGARAAMDRKPPREALPPIPSHRCGRSAGPDLSAVPGLRPLAALSRLAILRGRREVPILGMERHFPADLARPRSVQVFVAPVEGHRQHHARRLRRRRGHHRERHRGHGTMTASIHRC